jgi:tetratricopeptide (TPR) repeat protein
LDRERVARNRSERTFQLALDALNDVADELSHGTTLPQFAVPQDETLEDGDDAALWTMASAPPSPQAAAVLQRILPLYDQLSEEAPDRMDVLRRSIEASQRLGQIQLQLGALDEAAAAIDRGLDLLKTLPSQGQPSGEEAEQLRLLKGRLSNDLGQLQQLRNRPLAAEQAHRAALESLANAGQEPTVKLELARAHLALATGPHDPPTRLRRGMPGPAGGVNRRQSPEPQLAELEQAITILQPLADDAHCGFTAQLMLARCLRWRGLAAERSFRERQSDLQQAIQILRDLTSERPNSLEAKFELSQALGDGLFSFSVFSERGMLNPLQGRWEEALQLANDLHLAHPAVPAYAWATSQMAHKLSRLCRFRRQRAPARQYGLRALEVQRQLVDDFPEDNTYLAAYLQMLRFQAEIFWDAGQQPEAEKLLTEAAELLAQRRAESPLPQWQQLETTVQRALEQIHNGARPSR